MNSSLFRTQRLRVPFALCAIFMGVFLMAISSGYQVARTQVLALDKHLVQQYENTHAKQESERRSRPIHLHVEGVIDVSVEKAVFEEGTWTISDRVASYLLQSARPGEAGNIIIFGHNKKNILGRLDELKENQEVTLLADDGKKYVYRVVEVHEVTPTQTYFLEPTNEEVLTLYTCSGVFDTKRFIVRAKPV